MPVRGAGGASWALVRNAGQKKGELGEKTDRGPKGAGGGLEAAGICTRGAVRAWSFVSGMARGHSTSRVKWVGVKGERGRNAVRGS